ncbi:putative Mechanosensitive ion channel family protein [uncultured delta proteobacterium]|uniref:Putative Mechanosensitive ion channel family protein n=1 Tax=uncultured delta proteobacterium TaxID=34034 RepID=A0A212K183_9DELT|nr:putative Mechanosensitive ion channel family protein [uncultured delta proteobacterium]
MMRTGTCSGLLLQRVLLAALCWCALALAPVNGPALAAEPAGVGDGLSSIWGSRAEDMSALIREIEELRRNAEALAAPLSKTVMDARTQYTRLSGLLQASREHPAEQLTLVQQMHVLHERLAQSAEPLENIAATMGRRLEEVGALRADMAAIAKEDSQAGAETGLGGTASLDTAEAKALGLYQSKLAEAERNLKGASTRLSAILTPVRSMQTRVERAVAGIEESLVGTWEQYYLTPSANNLDALAATPAVLLSWAASLESRLSFAYPQNGSGWFESGKRFFLGVLIFGLLGYLAGRGARALPGRWNRAVNTALGRPWVLCGLGLSVILASANQSGGFYFGFMLLGSLLLIIGVATVSWRLRKAAVPSLENKASPLNRIYIPAAVGVLMLFSDLPTRVLGVVWGLTMLLFLVFNITHRRALDREGLPLLERFSYNSAFYFALASLLVSLAGYSRMAILLFMLLFALVNIVTMGSALMALLHILADRVCSSEKSPLLNSLAQALSIPAAWMLALLCALPWLWAVPGARYMLMRFFSMGYEVGGASLDFSKGLLILILFFLFRSLASLGKTSMEHLPNKIPHIERGVIPPLRNLLVYAIWAVFGLMSLSVLGLDFTSLAVVAGGLSVGIGFGMQNIFNNLISGLMLIFGRTILVGDFIESGGVSGTVKEISIKSTVVETPERALVYLPNSTLMAGQFSNLTRNKGKGMVRRTVTVGVAYGSDTALVARLLLEVAEKHERVFKHPAPAVFFTNFGASSLDFSMNVFVDFAHAVGTLSDLRFGIEKIFAENGIEIPFPQLTMHVPGGLGLTGRA